MFKISDFLEVIPKKLILSLLVILLIIILISQAFDYFINYNKKKINEINAKVENFVNEYYNITQKENYFAIIQFLSIDYLASNKKYLSKILENLPKYLPKNFSIERFSYNSKDNKIILEGSVPNWVDYAKYHKYFSQNQNIFPNFKIENLNFNRENLKVILTISFQVNYQELYK